MSKHTKQTLITEAQQIKNYIETNKKIPISCKLSDGIIVSPYGMSYLMACCIKDNFKSNYYPLPSVVQYNTTLWKDMIQNEKITRAEYLIMIDNFIKYCNDNKRVPSYITTKSSKTKVSFELFLYCLSKIVVYFNEKNTLPNYCIFNKADIQNSKSNTTTIKKSSVSSTSNCTNPYKSLPVNTGTGCDKMGQNTPYYCGVCALQKVLYKFGITISQKTLAAVAGTTTAGTSHQGIRTAIEYVSRKSGVKLSMKEYSFNELGIEGLAKMICKPNNDAIIHLCYRNKYGHYEKIKSINTKTGMLEIMNSLGNKCGSCYCGYIENRSLATEKQYMNGISQKSIIMITKG